MFHIVFIMVYKIGLKDITYVEVIYLWIKSLYTFDTLQ